MPDVENNQFLFRVVYFLIWILNKFRQSTHQLISKETFLVTRAFLQNVCYQQAVMRELFLFTQSYCSECSEGSLLLTHCPVCAVMGGWVFKSARGKRSRSTTSRLSPHWEGFFFWYIWTTWWRFLGAPLNIQHLTTCSPQPIS